MTIDWMHFTPWPSRALRKWRAGSSQPAHLPVSSACEGQGGALRMTWTHQGSQGNLGRNMRTAAAPSPLRRPGKRAILALLCTVLLCAQHAALAHSLWHVLQPLGPNGQDFVSVEIPSGHSPEQEFSNLCVHDATLGQLLGGAPVASFSFCLASGDSTKAPEAHRPFVLSRFLAPLSRGPPPLL